MTVLIVDDNTEFCSTLSDLVHSFGYASLMLNAPGDAIEYLEKDSKHINCILLDIEFGKNEVMNGLDVLEICRRKYRNIPVIMISGKGTIEMAVRATKLGAVNFIEKSVLTSEKLHEVLKSVFEESGFSGDRGEIQQFLHENGIVTRNSAMLELGDSIIRFGRTNLNVLITGETGTGKKLVAEAIHAVSKRCKNPFVTVDIPNIPRELFQSELFGHVKGAFSGALETKKGLFQQANHGTIFLDEIGDLSLELQSNLFIPIEDRSVRKVGSTEAEDLDVRFISATDRDLIKSISEGTYREQLYHRLRECGINIPPLRERREDIPLIIKYYIEKHNIEYNQSRDFTSAGVDFLTEQPWPGNVRELYSVVRVALQTCQNDTIDTQDLTRLIDKAENGAISQLKIKDDSDSPINSSRTLKEDLAEVDKMKIRETLAKTSGNVSKAAVLLAVSRETLHNKLRKYGISASEYRRKNI